MKSFFVISLILLVFSSVLGYGQFLGGSGTEADPYQITSREDLEAMADSISKNYTKYAYEHYKVMNNITDSIRKNIHAFSGVFDGQGYKITLALNDYNGLFDRAGRERGDYQGSATIKNVVIDGYIKYNLHYGQYNEVKGVGGICGELLHGEISNCVNLANITTNNIAWTGGIIGSITVAKSISANYNHKIMNCMNLGNVKNISFDSIHYHYDDDMPSVGGIIGATEEYYYYFNHILRNCVNVGITTGNYFVGGIAGLDITVENSINTGVARLIKLNIPNYLYDYNVGGIVGKIR